MKKAIVTLSWDRSASPDIVSRSVVVSVNGVEQTLETGNMSGEITVKADPMSSINFKTQVKDSEGKVAESVTVSTTIGDLEDPLPDTNLQINVTGIEDDSAPEES